MTEMDEDNVPTLTVLTPEDIARGRGEEHELGNMHGVLIRDLTKRIALGIATPAEKAIAAKMLKDNAITFNPAIDGEAAAMMAALKNKGRVPTKKEREQAMKELGNGLLQ